MRSIEPDEQGPVRLLRPGALERTFPGNDVCRDTSGPFAMPLQNRVTPSGDIIATPHRGLFTGNRGIIHDPATRTLLTRRWASKAWLTCVCEFRGRRRKVMGGRSWTELFFLDEATAFAAGHRPCFFCRRDDANRFRGVEEGNGVANVARPMTWTRCFTR